MHDTSGNMGRDCFVLQRPAESTQRSLMHRPEYIESEKLIPSVENDPYPSIRQKLPLGSSEAAASQWQLRDDIIGPRIIETHGDPLSPAHKRRRLANDEMLSSKVTYAAVSDQKPSVLVALQPSHVSGHSKSGPNVHTVPSSDPRWYHQGRSHPLGLVPVTGRAHRESNDDPMSGDGQRRPGLARLQYASSVPNMRSEHKQHVAFPSMQSQSRFSENFPADQKSHSFLSGPKPVFEMHEPPRLLRPVYTSPVAPHFEHPESDVASRRFARPAEHELQGLPYRPKPAHPADQNTRSYAHGEPAVNRTHGARGDIYYSGAEPQGFTSHQPSQFGGRASDTDLHPQAPKFDCPMAVRGSFCNRLRGNGFTRRDRLDEHMRNVHLLDMGKTREMDEAHISPPSRTPPRGQTAGQGSYPQSEERYRHGYHKTDQERDVVYISSSPLRGER